MGIVAAGVDLNGRLVGFDRIVGILELEIRHRQVLGRFDAIGRISPQPDGAFKILDGAFIITVRIGIDAALQSSVRQIFEPARLQTGQRRKGIQYRGVINFHGFQRSIN